MVFGDDSLTFRGYVVEGTLTESSDPRLTGAWSWIGNRDQDSDPDACIWNGAFRIENDDGAWHQVPTAWID
jgi:hypothetical protein